MSTAQIGTQRKCSNLTFSRPLLKQYLRSLIQADG